MSVVKLANVAIDTTQVTVLSSESLAAISLPAHLYCDGYGPEEIVSKDLSARTLTLADDWEGPNVTNGACRITTVPQSAAQTVAASQQQIASLTASAQQLLTRFAGVEAEYQQFMNDKFAALRAMSKGAVAFETLGELQLAGAPTTQGYDNDRVMAYVWNNPDTTKNGLYAWDDTLWVKAPTDANLDGRITAIETTFDTTDGLTANIGFDPFFELTGDNRLLGGFAHWVSVGGQYQAQTHSPYPYKTLQTSTGFIDRQYDLPVVGVGVGETLSLRVLAHFLSSNTRVSAYIRDASSNNLASSFAYPGGGLQDVHLLIAVPSHLATTLLIRAENQDGDNDIELIATAIGIGPVKPSFSQSNVPKVYLDALTSAATLPFANENTPITAENVGEALSESVMLSTDRRKLNLLPDPFFRQLGAGIAVQGEYATVEQDLTVASVSHDFADSGYALHIPSGFDENVDRHISIHSLGLVEGEDITATVVIDGPDDMQLGLYFRASDNSVVGPAGTVTKTGAGIKILSRTIAVDQSIIDSAAYLQVRVLAPSTAYSNDNYILGCNLHHGAARGVQDYDATLDYQAIAAFAQQSGDFDNEDTPFAATSLQAAVVEALAIANNDALLNMLPDPFLRQYDAGFDVQGDYPTINQAVTLVEQPLSPFDAKAIYIGAGTTDFLDRNVAFNALGLSEGDELTVCVGVIGDDRPKIAAYFRDSADNVLGSAITTNVTVDGYTVMHATYIVSSSQVAASYVQLRFLPPNGGFTHDAWVCGWGMYKGGFAGLADYDASKDRQVLFGVQASQSTADASLTPTIILPELLPVLHGSDTEANLYFGNCLQDTDPTHFVDVDAAYGKQLAECWRIKAGSDDSVSDGVDFQLNLTVTDGAQTELAATQTEVNVVSPSSTAIRLLAIGDSITRDGRYVEHAVEQLITAQTLGTRKYDYNDFAVEGRGGWTLSNYVTRFEQRTLPDSPFLFPTNVAGDLYFGNTATWLRAMNEPTNYHFEGFQLIAKDWDENGVYQYDATTGFRLNPPTGAVMFDGEDTRVFYEFDGASWQVMATQPTGAAFDVSKYLTRYASAFSAGEPTHISILSGPNEFQNDADGDISNSQFASYQANIDTIIGAVHAHNPAIKIMICTSLPGASQDGASTWNGSGTSSAKYNDLIKQLNARVLAAYDNATQRANNVFIAPMHTCIDVAASFPTQTQTRNKYSTELITRQTDLLHPNAFGHQQMGDCLAATISLAEVLS